MNDAPVPEGSPAGNSPASRKLVRAVRRGAAATHPVVAVPGLTYPWLSDLLKEIFVEVADREFRLDRKRQTDSRISLLTGVHRKDVKRIREEMAEVRDPPPPAVSLGAQLVARWVSDPDYLDEEGSPIPLARLASQGGDRSFDALVASVSKDIRARAVLDEWLRLGVARLDETDNVILNVDAFVPAQGFDEKVFYFGQNVHDHTAAAVSNVIGDRAPLLERSVHYDTLTPASVAEIAAAAERFGMQALKNVNRKAAQLDERDTADPEAVMRINFGIYFYSEPMQDGEDGDEPSR